jgi:hypothetical protein
MNVFHVTPIVLPVKQQQTHVKHANLISSYTLADVSVPVHQVSLIMMEMEIVKNQSRRLSVLQDVPRIYLITTSVTRNVMLVLVIMITLYVLEEAYAQQENTEMEPTAQHASIRVTPAKH